MWPHVGYTDVDVRVNCDSFAAHGISCDAAFELVALGAKPWNTTGGSLLRLKDPVDTTKWEPDTDDEVIVTMLTQASNPGIIGFATYGCNGRSNIRLYSNFYQSGTIVPGSNDTGTSGTIDSVTVLAHEFGHSLGLLHANESGGSCGEQLYSGRALMQPFYGVGVQARALFRDDWDSLWAGSSGCSYTKAPPPDTSKVMRLLVSGDQGDTWGQVAEWSWWDTSNHGPALADTPTGMLAAWPNYTGSTRMWRWTGGSPTVVSGVGGLALAGPALAYGGGQYILAFPMLGHSPAPGTLRLWRSTDGNNWTASQEPNIRSGNRPALAWHAGAERFYLAVTSFPGYASVSAHYRANRIEIWWSETGAPGTWSGPYADGDPEEWEDAITGHVANAGPGLTCPPETGGRCWLAYPDARSAVGTIRQRVFIPCAGFEDPWPSCQAQGDVVAASFTQNTQLAASDGVWTASRNDVALAHDPSEEAIVFGYVRNSHPSWTGFVNWMENDDTTPPPGFAGEPPPGFYTGGGPIKEATAAMALEVQPFSGAHLIYVLAHSPAL
jgi:hypothetical protein